MEQIFEDSQHMRSGKMATKIPRFRNFREVAGAKRRIYRSATTDVLADQILQSEISDDARFVIEHVSLVLDLRSPVERDERSVVTWTSMAPTNSAAVGAKRFHVHDGNIEALVPNQRHLVRLNLLDQVRFRRFVESKLSTQKMVDAGRGFGLVVAFVREHGLQGLYQALLQQNQMFCSALKIITHHLEQESKNIVLFHCSQGKDRTGLLAMMIQSILGLCDDDIVKDYNLSSNKAPPLDVLKSAANDINTKLFNEAPAEVMMDTLAHLRSECGSVQGYLLSIGFSAEWQKRLLETLSQKSGELAVDG